MKKKRISWILSLFVFLVIFGFTINAGAARAWIENYTEEVKIQKVIRDYFDKRYLSRHANQVEDFRPLLDDSPQTCPRGITARITTPFGQPSPKVPKSLNVGRTHMPESMIVGSYALLVVAVRSHLDAERLPLDHRPHRDLRRTCLVVGCFPLQDSECTGAVRLGHASQEPTTNGLTTHGHARCTGDRAS